MTYKNITLGEQRRLALQMREVIESRTPPDVYERLRTRLRDLGDNVLDEVQQFRQLQKAVNESPELAQALSEAGFGRIDRMDPVVVTADVGRIVQIFNRLVEDHWEAEAPARTRRVVYKAGD